MSARRRDEGRARGGPRRSRGRSRPRGLRRGSPGRRRASAGGRDPARRRDARSSGAWTPRFDGRGSGSASKAAKAARVARRCRWRHEQHAGRVPGDRGERGDPLAATLDERRATDEEERHVGARCRRCAPAILGVPVPPHASNAPSIAAAASLLPPARPAATGIRFSSRTASGNVSDPRPTTRRASAMPARTDRTPPGRASCGHRRRRPHAGCRRGRRRGRG